MRERLAGVFDHLADVTATHVPVDLTTRRLRALARHIIDQDDTGPGHD